MFEIFPTFLSTASTAVIARGGKIVLILDAVNQLGERKNARELNWIHIITGVTWIISTHGGPTLRAIRRREWPEVQIIYISANFYELLYMLVQNVYVIGKFSLFSFGTNLQF